MGLQLALKGMNSKRPELLDAVNVEIIEDSFNSCAIAVEILNDILTYDKLEAGDLKLNCQSINISTIVTSIVSSFAIQVTVYSGIVHNNIQFFLIGK